MWSQQAYAGWSEDRRQHTALPTPLGPFSQQQAIARERAEHAIAGHRTLVLADRRQHMPDASWIIHKHRVDAKNPSPVDQYVERIVRQCGHRVAAERRQKPP